MQFSPSTQLNAVFGHPIGQSLSPKLHNAIYEKENIDAVFLAFDNSDIAPLIAAMRTLPIHLAAVTIPHKEKVIPFLDNVDAAAREVGSVNTIINEAGVLTGYNTDVVGVREALKVTQLAGKDVLTAGAGGAARAVCFVLREAGARIHIFDRTVSKAETLGREFGGEAYAEMPHREFDVYINATPVGMSPNENETPIPKGMIRSGSVVFDLVYKPRETRLMREAKEKGAKVVSGIVMFLAQAIEQERLWLKREISAERYAGTLDLD